MSQELLSCRSSIIVLGQALGDEILKLLAEIALQPWGSVLGDVEEDFHGVNVAQRWFTIGHFHRRDAQRPNISLETVAILLNDFWGHPKGRSDKGVPLRLDIGQLRSDTEVSEFDLASLGKEDIGGLDISVDFAFAVEILDTKEELAAHDGDVILAKVCGFQLEVPMVSFILQLVEYA